MAREQKNWKERPRQSNNYIIHEQSPDDCSELLVVTEKGEAVQDICSVKIADYYINDTILMTIRL